MRIIGGKFKGKKILQPKDKETRPLKDLAKESIFNILTHEVVLTPNYSGMWRDIRTGHHFDITNRRISKLHNAIFVRPVRKILGRLV